MGERASGLFIFQQDGAHAHWACKTVQLLREQMPDCMGLKSWPPNSPDLSPVDYGIWERLQEPVYCKLVCDPEKLKVKQ